MSTLNWIGKEAVFKHHIELPLSLLELVAGLTFKTACPESVEDQNENLIDQGGSWLAFKELPQMAWRFFGESLDGLMWELKINKESGA